VVSDNLKNYKYLPDNLLDLGGAKRLLKAGWWHMSLFQQRARNHWK